MSNGVLVLELVAHHGDLDDQDLVSLSLVCKRVSVSAQFELSKRKYAWEKDEYLFRFRILRKKYSQSDYPEFSFPDKEILESMNLIDLKATYDKTWSEAVRLHEAQNERSVQLMFNQYIQSGMPEADILAMMRTTFEGMFPDSISDLKGALKYMLMSLR